MKILPDLLVLLGTTLVVYGVGMKSVPAAIVIAGLACFGIAVLLGREEARAKG